MDNVIMADLYSLVVDDAFDNQYTCVVRELNTTIHFDLDVTLSLTPISDARIMVRKNS